MMASHVCPICRWLNGTDHLAGGILTETDHFYVFHRQLVPAPVIGWLIIAPKDHLITQTEIPADWQAELTGLQFRLTQLLEKTTRSERVYWVLFSEEVRHIHFHLIPRQESMPEEKRGPAIFSWKPEDGAGRLEIEGFCDFFRQQAKSAGL